MISYIWYKYTKVITISTDIWLLTENDISLMLWIVIA